MAYGLGATVPQPPTSKIVNPDGTTTFYFGPAPDVVKNFPAAAAAVPLTPAEQQAAVAAALGQGTPSQGSGSMMPWLIGGAALIAGWLFLRR